MATLELNERALRVVEEMVVRAEELRVGVGRLGSGARVVDCGVEAEGGLGAGLWMARVCLAGLGEVGLVPGEVGGVACPAVQVWTDQPLAACMRAQYAGWQISVGKYFAMGSGPMRAAAGREELFERIGGREEASVAVGVLETRKLPTEEVAAYICERTRVRPEGLTLLAAPTASQAGTVQIVARSVETALHKLVELGFDISKMVSGYGTAPLSPVAGDDLAAIGRTNDAILYGGRVVLWHRAEEGEVEAVGPRVPSSASADHGAPFAEIFERYGKDFYKIDKMLFSPAEVEFRGLKTGRTRKFGRVETEVVQRSFFGE